jgi:hypothetical protein
MTAKHIMVAMFYSVGSFFVGSNSASSCLSTHANNTMVELMQVRGEGEHAGVCCIDDYIREVCEIISDFEWSGPIWLLCVSLRSNQPTGVTT